MKSMFAQVPFGRKDGGLVSLAPKGLGVDIPPWLMNILPGTPDELAKLIAEGIGKLPADIGGNYQVELDRCKALLAKGGDSATEGGKCIYALFQAMKNGTPIPTAPPTTPLQPTTQPTSGGFPWIPVAVGVGALGLLIFALTRGK